MLDKRGPQGAMSRPPAPKRQKNFWKRYWSELVLLVLALCLLLQVTVFSPVETVAEPNLPYAAMITHDEVSLRGSADPEGELILYMYAGDKVTVIDEDYYGVPVNDNSIWYKIEYQGVTGWVTSEYCEHLKLPSIADSTSVEQLEYYSELQALGFPEDYCRELYALHLKYPSWRFTPLFTNYSFATAVDGEYQNPGLNLVPASGPDAHKSKAASDFNYQSNTWHQYEYGWVGASREIIAHVMDPRNFLNEREIFQFENLQYNPEVQNVAGVRRILEGTFMAGEDPLTYVDYTGSTAMGDSPYAEVFIQAAEYANVNPYHLASRVKLEVSAEGSDSVSGNYRGIVGHYNFFNIGAYPTPGEGDSVYNGLITARDGISGISQEAYDRLMFPWTSPYRAILGGASFLGRDYINADQQTLYLQKFNLVSRYFAPFQHQYMGNIFAPKLESHGVYEAYRAIDMLDQPKEFLIPVFTDLPAGSYEPVVGGNPNNRLASLEINGEPVPDFNSRQDAIEVTLAGNVIHVDIIAKAADPFATVTGDGYFIVSGEINQHVITVTAQDGSTRDYKLIIHYQKVSDEVGESIFGSRYQVDGLGYLYGVDPAQGTQQIENFEASLNQQPGVTLEYLAPDGSPAARIGTGTQLKVYQNGILDQIYVFVIRGDIDGNGLIDLDDAWLISQYLTGEQALSSAAVIAMDVNGDGLRDLADAKAIKRAIVDGRGLSQSSH